ncbi:hypothetical protein Dimus_025618 [Dionaea muscipula]
MLGSDRVWKNRFFALDIPSHSFANQILHYGVCSYYLLRLLSWSPVFCSKFAVTEDQLYWHQKLYYMSAVQNQAHFILPLLLSCLRISLSHLSIRHNIGGASVNRLPSSHLPVFHDILRLLLIEASRSNSACVGHSPKDGRGLRDAKADDWPLVPLVLLTCF